MSMMDALKASIVAVIIGVVASLAAAGNDHTLIVGVTVPVLYFLVLNGIKLDHIHEELHTQRKSEDSSVG